MDTRCPKKYQILKEKIVLPQKSHNESLSCQASHSVPFFKGKLIQKVLSPASHSLIVFSSSIHSLPSLTVFPPQRIHPKFNYFRGGFSKRNGRLSQHSQGSGLALRNASPSHIRTQTISAINDQGFNCFAIARPAGIGMKIYPDLLFEISLVLMCFIWLFTLQVLTLNSKPLLVSDAFG